MWDYLISIAILLIGVAIVAVPVSLSRERD